MQAFRKPKPRFHRRLLPGLLIFLIAAFALAGGYLLKASHAATYSLPAEAEASAESGQVARCSSPDASGGLAERFGSTSCSSVVLPSGQAIGWNNVINGPGGAWHRLLKLDDGSWLRVSTSFPAAGRSELVVFKSTDNARTWKTLSGVNDGNRLVDNGFLYKAPNGDLLLSGRNLINGSNYRISQWRSTNSGVSWQREAEVKNSGRGAWEPFYFTAGTKTVVMWSDEGYGGYSQVLVERVSSDNGKTWGGESIVASDGQNGRPGMSTVARMSNGQYIMTFEVCGTQGCRTFNKKSADGTSWPGGIGSSIPGQTCGPFVLSLTNGRVVATSCRVSDGNTITPISYSDDYGVTWKTNAPAFTNAGTFGNWPALYQSGPDEMMAVSGSAIRFGTIGSR